MLNVIIPTYNSAKYLQNIFERNPFFLDENVKVYILDNCSSDNTCDVCKHLKGKYSNLFYMRFTNHVCAGENVVRGLKLNLEGYRWIFGDRYTFLGDIKFIYKWIGLSHINEIMIISSRNLNKADKINTNLANLSQLLNCEEAFLSASCLSTAIYPAEFNISEYDKVIYSDSAFPHTALILAALHGKFNLSYCNNISVQPIKGENNWSYRNEWIATGCMGWFNMLMNVQLVVGCNFRRAAFTLFTRGTSLGKTYGALKRRSLGVLNIALLASNFKTLHRCYCVRNHFMLYLIAIIPISLSSLILKIHTKEK